MGFFDIKIQQKTSSTLTEVKETLQEKSKEIIENKNSLEVKKYKPSLLLRYNLKITQNKDEITIEGELLDTLFITILIVLGILFTYGFAVIVIVGYIFLQQRAVTNYLKALTSNKSQ